MALHVTHCTTAMISSPTSYFYSSLVVRNEQSFSIKSLDILILRPTNFNLPMQLLETEMVIKKLSIHKKKRDCIGYS